MVRGALTETPAIHPTTDAAAWQAQLEPLLARTSLTAEERRALAVYLAALCDGVGDLLDEIVLYGSAARGEERSVSDVDLLLVLNREIDRETRAQIQKLTPLPGVDTAASLQPLVMSPSSYHWHREGSPLWHNIQRDGIWLMGAPPPSIYQLPGGKSLDEKRRELIRLYLEHGDEDLELARLALDAGLLKPAISRSYHALFYAVSAVLLTKGIERRKHEGVKSAFGEYFTNVGGLPREMGRLLNELFEDRLSADYKMDYAPGEEAAAQRFQQAQEAVETIKTHLREKGFLDD